VACKNHPDRDSVAACVTCGDELCAECNNVGSDGKSYCAKDLPTEGTAAAVPPPAPTAAPPPPTPASSAAPPPPAAAAGSSNPVLAAFAYPIWIIALIIVVSDMKRDRYMAYHGWNALFWGIAYIIVLIALGVLTGTLHDVPGLGTVLRLLNPLARLAFLVFSIIFAIKAYNRQDVNIPVISDMARKQVG
jgi:uncharacterized membrane protein